MGSVRRMTLGMNDNRHIQAAEAANGRLACGVCGEPIGVYEPLIAIERGRARRSALAAEPQIATTSGECRHLECHERHSRAAARETRDPMRAHGAAHARERSVAG